MEKVRPWCGQPLDRGWLKNRTVNGKMGNGNLGNHLGKMGNGKLGDRFTVNGIPLKESTHLYGRCCHSLCLMSSKKIANVSG